MRRNDRDYRLEITGYYKIKQGILQQNLSSCYRFEKAEKLCEYFNEFVNALIKEREQESPNHQIIFIST